MRLAIGIVALLAGVTMSAQSRPVVLLDVVVDGVVDPASLTAADFNVSDADGPLAIESVRMAPATGPEDEPLPQIRTAADELSVAASASRIVGIFLDEYHLPSGNEAVAVRDALATFVRRTLGPRDLVLVARPLDSLTALRLTSDREEAARTVEAMRGRFGDYSPGSSFEQDFIPSAPAQVDSARAQISLSTVRALVLHLGRFSNGRKTLIVASGGFTPRAEARRDQAFSGIDGVIRAATRGRVAVYPIRVDAATPTTPAAVPEPAGAGASAAAFMSRLATETSGFMLEGDPSLGDGLQRIARDASRYLVLALTPSPQADDGRFRPVTVSVRRPGLGVRTRTGYSTALESAELATAPRAARKPGLTVPRHTSTRIRPWFGLAPGVSDQTRVSFVWEPSVGVPGERAGVRPARVFITVSTMEGDVLFSGASSATGPDAGGTPDASVRLSFEVPKGQFLVQMEIRDAAGRVVDRDVRDLVIAGFQPLLAMGTPEVLRARTARELRDLLDSPDASPIVSRQFSRAEHLIVRVPIASSTGEVDVTARLSSSFGTLLRELSVSRAGSPAATAQVEFPLASLASGAYTVQFTARSQGRTAVDQVGFTVRP